MSIGEILRTEREKQGLSLADISRRTYIAESYLWALETDDYSRLPGAVYIKGWLRNYGETLGLSGIALVDRWNEEHRSRRRPIIAGAAVRAERSYITSPERVELLGRKRRGTARRRQRSRQARIWFAFGWLLLAVAVVWIFWL